MSDAMSTLLAQVLATDVPVLPSLGLQQVWLHLGWSVVLAWVGVWLAGVCRLSRTWQLAVALFAWAWVPGPLGASYWLGLAFQAPAITTAGLCLLLLGRRWRDRDVRNARFVRVGNAALTLSFAGVVTGWALLLDSFAVLPWQLYALGFSPLVPALAAVVALLPWVAVRNDLQGVVLRKLHPARVGWALLLAALAFAVLRLPSGNAWDALLDPFLWVALHGVWFRALRS